MKPLLSIDVPGDVRRAVAIAIAEELTQDLPVVFPSDGDEPADCHPSRQSAGVPLLTVLPDEVERGDIIAGLTTPVDGMICSQGVWVYCDVHGRPICRRPNWGTVQVHRPGLALGGPVTYGDDPEDAA